MDGLSFLRRTVQNYVQFGAEKGIHITNPSVNNEEEVDVVMFKGWYEDICMGTREEFNKMCAMSDHDYRIDESSILFEFKDPKTVSKITDAVIEGYLNQDSFDKTLSSIIDIIDKPQKLELK